MKNRSLLILVLSLFTSVLCGAQNIMLWGMTYDGGIDSLGVLYNYDVTTHTYTVVHNFGVGTDGGMPQGALIKANNGLLYGMTQYGGANNYGMLFSYNISTGAYTNLHDFGSGTDGTYPSGSLLQARDGILYGLTGSGGLYSNRGTLFSYNIATGTYTCLYSFGDRLEGISPVGSLIQGTDSLLYGCTSYGGRYGGGTIFSYNTGNTAVLYLHNFNDGGNYPSGSLVQANNNLLYGLTWSGGNDSAGTLFSYDIASRYYTNVHNFDSTTGGFNPTGSLIQASNGLLFGSTRHGGTYNPTQGSNGLVFSYDIETDSEVVIRSFRGSPDGAFPSGALMEASDGTIYGTTADGGATGLGFMFAYSINHNVYFGLHNFDLGTDGANPFGGLLEVDQLTAGEIRVTANTALQISPNPTTGRFTLQLPGNQSSYPVQVYNTLGQKVEELNLSYKQNTINLDSQPTGMYFIVVQIEAGSTTAKVMLAK